MPFKGNPGIDNERWRVWNQSLITHLRLANKIPNWFENLVIILEQRTS